MSGGSMWRSQVECPFYKRDDPTNIYCEGIARKKQYQKEHREELNAYSREYRKRRKENSDQGRSNTDSCSGDNLGSNFGNRILRRV